MLPLQRANPGAGKWKSSDASTDDVEGGAKLSLHSLQSALISAG